jgi:ankyrin repeat protein
MKRLVLTTVAAVVLVGCGPSVNIWNATKEGNTEAVKQAVANGVDVNAKNNDGCTALFIAANRRNKEVVELLISEGADVSVKTTVGRFTPLHEVRSKEIAELLINNGADVNAKNGNGWTPLHSAALDSYRNIIELLIEHGADVNAKNSNGGTPLDAAIQRKMNWTRIDAAFEEKMNEVADLLRKYGGKYGFIHTAAVGGDTEAVKEFLAAGVDVNAKDNEGYTALHLAAGKRGSLEVVKLLITEGVNVNVKNNGGATPLHFAAFYGQEGVTNLLIDNGVDVNMKGLTGETPLDWAMRGENGFNANRFHKEIVDLIRKHGGKTGEELKAEGK